MKATARRSGSAAPCDPVLESPLPSAAELDEQIRQRLVDADAARAFRMATGFSSGRGTINSHAVLPAVIIGVSEEGTIGLQVLVSLERALEIATKITAAVERLRAEKGAPVMTTHRSDRGRIAAPDGDNDSHLQRDSAPSF